MSDATTKGRRPKSTPPDAWYWNPRPYLLNGDGTSLRHWFPRGTGEAPRRPPVRGFSMRDVHSKQSSKMGEGSRGFLCDLWWRRKRKSSARLRAWRPLEILSLAQPGTPLSYPPTNGQLTTPPWLFTVGLEGEKSGRRSLRVALCDVGGERLCHHPWPGSHYPAVRRIRDQ